MSSGEALDTLMRLLANNPAEKFAEYQTNRKLAANGSLQLLAFDACRVDLAAHAEGFRS